MLCLWLIKPASLSIFSLRSPPLGMSGHSHKSVTFYFSPALPASTGLLLLRQWHREVPHYPPHTGASPFFVLNTRSSYRSLLWIRETVTKASGWSAVHSPPVTSYFPYTSFHANKLINSLFVLNHSILKFSLINFMPCHPPHALCYSYLSYILELLLVLIIILAILVICKYCACIFLFFPLFFLLELYFSITLQLLYSVFIPCYYFYPSDSICPLFYQ